MTSFEGKNVILELFYPAIESGDLDAYGKAKVEPGHFTFPSVGELSTGRVPIATSSVLISSSEIGIYYPTDEEGTTFVSGGFNGFVFDFSKIHNITGASVAVTDIPGVTNALVSFNSHEVALNMAGISLPFLASGFEPDIVMSVTFGKHHASAGASAALQMNHAIASFSANGNAPLLGAAPDHSANSAGMTLAPPGH